MRGNDGAVVEETEQVLEVLAKHWEELGKSHNSLGQEQEPELVHESSDMYQEIGWKEVVRVLKMLKREKAPGPDGILNEMLSYGGSRMVESLRCNEEAPLSKCEILIARGLMDMQSKL